MSDEKKFDAEMRDGGARPWAGRTGFALVGGGVVFRCALCATETHFLRPPLHGDVLHARCCAANDERLTWHFWTKWYLRKERGRSFPVLVAPNAVAPDKLVYEKFDPGKFDPGGLWR